MADVIIKIIKDLDARDLHSALQVNREWCRATIPTYWKAPFSFTTKRSITALKVYESFLEREGTAEKSTQQTAQKPFFDYPLFLKELNYTNLLACLDTYERVEKVEAILQMLTNYEIRLKTFIMDNTGTNNDRVYGLWTMSSYASIFGSLNYVEIHTPFPKNNVMKALAKNCTKLVSTVPIKNSIFFVDM